MISFQQDLLLILNKSHEEYISKINTIFNNEYLINEMSLIEAEKLIEYIKEYKTLISSICLLVDKINNIKNYNEINYKIETELMLKIMPIMNIYRTLLYEKYNNNTNKISSVINDQD